MTSMGRRERHTDTSGDETGEGVLARAASLRDQARLSAHNVVVLGEQIAGHRLIGQRAPHRSPLERWLDAHGQAARCAMAGLGELTSPLAALVLWTELSSCWLDANMTLLDALLLRQEA